MSSVTFSTFEGATFRCFVCLETIVFRADLYFAAFIIFLPWDLRAALANRRKILHCDRKCIWFCNKGPKFWRLSSKKIGGQKRAKFDAILDEVKLWWRISPDRWRYSKSDKYSIYQKSCCIWRISPVNFGPVTTEAKSYPLKSTFSGDHISALGALVFANFHAH